MATALFKFCFLSFSIISSLASPTHNSIFPVRQTYDFPKGTWVENLAVRRNGQILATLMSTPELVQVNPFHKMEPTVLHTFPNALGLLGIIETIPDVFVVVSGNFSLTAVKSTPGSYTAWSVDMRVAKVAEKGKPLSSPRVSKIADLSRAAFVNGIAALEPKQEAVLLADSALGVIFRLDLQKGLYKVVIDDPLMKGTNPEMLEGINGLKVHEGHLYFSNTDRGLFVRIPIHPDGTAASAATVVATAKSSFYTWDDFVIDKHGTTYVATLKANSITKITPSGEVKIAAGNENSADIAGPTSVAFGRTTKDKDTIYISTGGGLAAPINGSIVIGGQIVAVDLGYHIA